MAKKTKADKKNSLIKTKAYKVNYTKAIGGIGTVIIKAKNPTEALKNAKFSVASGKDFRNAKLVALVEYKKPRKQGFAGRN
jgi:hypothetical protein